MDYELVEKTNIWHSLCLTYKPAERFNAGDVVRALLKHTSDVRVEWEDNGDVGMKDGDSCTGQEFVYPAMLNAWGGCSYNIEATYDGMRMRFCTFTNEQNISSGNIMVFVNTRAFSEEQLKELQDVTIPRLLGWIGDD